MRFNGKTALVTGASRGIGRAIAVELARCGVSRILLVARNRPALEAVAADLQRLGAEAIVLPLDLTDTIRVNVAIAQAWRHHGPIQLLVNCAGVAYQTPFLKARLPQVQTELATNLVGLYTVTRLVAKRMAARQDGHIINVASLMGKVAAPTMATYSATKFAILGFTQALRGELAPYNVRVTALLPSLTDTDMIRDIQCFRWVKADPPEQVARSLITGLQRGSPEILVGWQGHIALWGQRLAPRLLDRIVQMATPPMEPRRQAVIHSR